MDVGALGRSVTAVLRVDAASCGSHLAVRTRQFDARLVRAAFVEIRTVAGLCFGGPPGHRMARQPPGSCGLNGRAADERSAGIRAGGASRPDDLPDECASHARARVAACSS